MDKGLVRHWCATTPVTLTWAQTHTHTQTPPDPSDWPSSCGVMRGVMCEGGVGDRGAEGLRASECERERDAEVV